MAPIQKIQTDSLSGRSPRPGAGANAGTDVKAPTAAPTQTSAVTADGVAKKTAPTFSQSPTLKPSPPNNGSTNIISDQRQPAPRGPRAPLGGDGYGN